MAQKQNLTFQSKRKSKRASQDFGKSKTELSVSEIFEKLMEGMTISEMKIEAKKKKKVL